MRFFRPTLIALSFCALIGIGICIGVSRGHSMSYFSDKSIVDRTQVIDTEEGAVPPPIEKETSLPGGGMLTRPAEEIQLDTAKDDFTFGDEDEAEIIFMGDEKEGGAGDEGVEQESSEYKEAKDRLFLEPVTRLGARPLKLTLEDCIRLALLNNNKIQSSEYGIDSAKAQYSEASARFWPIFEYEWLTAPVPSNASNAIGSFFRGDLKWWNKIRIAMGMPLYAFGKLDLAQDLARGGITAAREERKKQKLSTVTEVRQLYYGVLMAEELGHLLTEAYKKLSDAVEKKDKNGRSPTDRIKARVFLVDLEKRLAEARDKEILALEGLRVQLGLNPDVAVMVYSDKLRPIKTVLKPLTNYMETALENRPDAKLIEVGVETRRKQYQLEKRRFLPNIGAGAYLEIGRTVGTVTGITTTDNFSDPFNFSRAGIGMRVEGKFDVHGQIARVKKAKSDYYKASLDHYMAKDGIGLDIKKAHMDASTALDNVRRTSRAEKFARQLMFLTKSNYDLGVGEEQEYIDALQLVLFTRGRYFESVFNYNVSLAILDEKAGIIPEIKPAKE